MDEERLTRPRSSWTEPDDYIAALARKRTARRGRKDGGRTQPEAPLFSLSTLPFLALIGALILLGLGIMVAAWPGSQPEPRQMQTAAHEPGVAARGWLQEAEKDFH